MKRVPFSVEGISKGYHRSVFKGVPFSVEGM